ncbi:MAG: glycogen/starch/alpha-glucan phosphorylase, partial [Clostridiales bacterium]|nr:glycogen/starch/alpha-glucan phosphorylase [Clostridiales bacterium]
GWRKDLMKLENLVPFATDPAFVEKFAKIKQENKIRLANHLNRRQGAVIDPNTIFDSQAKRLHEYKRQLMNILTVMMLYNRIVEDESFSIEPRTYLFGAKAAPGYYRAKLIIKLINSVAELVKKHPRASKMINIVFIENYCVSAAELLMPATDVSEQLSTAGKEASGTGNMKFMMNGAVTIGTMDGANVEIYDQVGAENIYIFGMRADTVAALESAGGYNPMTVFENNAEIRRALTQMIDGTLMTENPAALQALYHDMLFDDRYFVLKDFGSYSMAQRRVNDDYQDRDKWLRMAVINTAKSGIFSSDRTIREYNEKIWHLK